MRNLAMSWNSKDGRLACHWRDLERIESGATLHEVEPHGPSAKTQVEGA
jgi:hypothetical protein